MAQVVNEDPRQRMGDFIKRLIWFQVPLVLIVGPLWMSLALARELVSCDEIVADQRAHQSLVALAYSDPIRCLKARMLEARGPKVVALGSSRVMQFRESFFRDSEQFYNAGGAVERMRDFNAFLEQVDTRSVELFVIGLDHYFFNVNYDDMQKAPKTFENTYSTLGVLREQKLVRDYRQGKVDYGRLRRPGRVGLTAMMYDEGFRRDGSYRYGRIIDFPELAGDIDFHDTFERMRTGKKRFQYGAEVNPAALRELDLFLKTCRERGIEVVAILPPFAHRVWNALLAQGEDYAYMRQLDSELKPLFEAHSFELFDFSDIASLGSDDTEAIDGFHGSEVAYLRLTLSVAERSPVLRRYVDSDRLGSLLEGVQSGLEISSERL